MTGEFLSIICSSVPFAASPVSVEDCPEPSYGEETICFLCCQRAVYLITSFNIFIILLLLFNNLA